MKETDWLLLVAYIYLAPHTDRLLGTLIAVVAIIISCYIGLTQ